MSDIQNPDDKGPAGGKEQILAELAGERERRKQAEATLATAEQTIADLTTKVSAAETAASDAAAQAARFQVLREKNVPRELDDFITGSTAEELATSADKALAAFNPPPVSEEAPKLLGMRPDGTQGAEDVALNSDALEQGLRNALNI